MPEFLAPEFLRTPLEEVVLKIKFLGLGDVTEFLNKVLDSPKKEYISRAVNTLEGIGALTRNQELTPLGLRLAKLPMNPKIGKMVLMGLILKCLDPVLTVAAALSLGKDPFSMKVLLRTCEKT